MFLKVEPLTVHHGFQRSIGETNNVELLCHKPLPVVQVKDLRKPLHKKSLAIRRLQLHLSCLMNFHGVRIKNDRHQSVCCIDERVAQRLALGFDAEVGRVF